MFDVCHAERSVATRHLFEFEKISPNVKMTLKHNSVINKKYEEESLQIRTDFSSLWSSK